jgi:pyruvate/2-oxoglutarate dehydrogenase complex dihydrolipoamide acyltransferase (E2) component
MEVLVDEGCWTDAEPGTEALLDKWLVAEGTRVEEGQAIAEVVLVKATFEIPAPATGTLARILVPAASTVARGKPIALLNVEAAA